jgi:serine protease
MPFVFGFRRRGLRRPALRRSRVAALVLASGAIATAVGATPPPPARVIVGFRADAALVQQKAASDRERLAMRAKALGARLGRTLDAGAALSERVQVVSAAGMSSDALAATLREQPDVEYAVPDERRHRYAVPNDPLYLAGAPDTGPAAGQWYLRPPAAGVRSAIDAESAWRLSTGSPGVVVAVVDTGVRFEHPDLLAVDAGGHLLPGYDMIADVDVANDGDGRDADASDPGDWVTADEVATIGGRFDACDAEDSSWHGTKVAGLIGALTDNGIGMASVARDVRILPVRALGKCGGFDSDIIAGMRWAAGLAVPGVPANPTPASIINLSLGGDGTCHAAYQQAVADITAAGVAIVAAAGNSAGHQVGVPGRCAGVIAVGALRHIGTKVGFSDLGPEVAISAPGGNCVNTTAGAPCLYPILTATTSGATAPGTPTWSDGVHPSLGTSFATPLVSGTLALMRAVRPSLTVAQATQLLKATSRPFPTAGSEPATTQCKVPQYDATGAPIDQLECYCTTATCGAGMLDTGSAVLAASANASVAAARVEGLWWKAPAGSESGWGLNVAQQGSVVFVTWFTYDAQGRAWWLSMTANAVGAHAYAGTLYATRGPAFDAVPFDPARVVATPVGTATLVFGDDDHGTFTYTVGGITQSKAITRQVFGEVPACTFGLLADPSGATNVQDLWWNAPAGSESGWGLNVVQQGSVLFATWFTYDLDGAPLWLAMTATPTAPGRYSGTLYRTTGPSYDAVPFDRARVVATPVGTGTLMFTSGNAGTFTTTVNGITRSKSITREVFAGTGTVCR